MKTKSKKVISTIFTVLVIVLYFGYLYLDGVPTPVLTEPVVIGVSTSAPQSQSDQGFEVYFTTPNNHIENHLIEKIDNAQTSLDLAVFEFDLDNVKDALIRAHRRGVKVQIVYDNEHTDPDPQMGELIAAGISAVPDERSAFMHNKFFVIDGQCVWTGSFNITVNASTKNNENAIYICDQKLAQNYETEFSEMFAGNFGPKSSPDTPFPQLDLLGSSAQNYFAPEDNVMDQILTVVSDAKLSIHFMAFSFTDDNLGNLMLSKSANDIAVVGIFETRGASSDSSQCQNLKKNGIDVRLDGNPYTFHHKVIVVDDKTVIFGSFNFSNNANESNDENLLIITNPQLAQQFESEFQARLAESKVPDRNCK